MKVKHSKKSAALITAALLAITLFAACGKTSDADNPAPSDGAIAPEITQGSAPDIPSPVVYPYADVFFDGEYTEQLIDGAAFGEGVPRGVLADYFPGQLEQLADLIDTAPEVYDELLSLLFDPDAGILSGLALPSDASEFTNVDKRFLKDAETLNPALIKLTRESAERTEDIPPDMAGDLWRTVSAGGVSYIDSGAGITDLIDVSQPWLYDYRVKAPAYFLGEIAGFLRLGGIRLSGITAENVYAISHADTGGFTLFLVNYSRVEEKYYTLTTKSLASGDWLLYQRTFMMEDGELALEESAFFAVEQEEETPESDADSEEFDDSDEENARRIIPRYAFSVTVPPMSLMSISTEITDSLLPDPYYETDDYFDLYMDLPYSDDFEDYDGYDWNLRPAPRYTNSYDGAAEIVTAAEEIAYNGDALDPADEGNHALKLGADAAISLGDPLWQVTSVEADVLLGGAESAEISIGFHSGDKDTVLIVKLFKDGNFDCYKEWANYGAVFAASVPPAGFDPGKWTRVAVELTREDNGKVTAVKVGVGDGADGENFSELAFAAGSEISITGGVTLNADGAAAFDNIYIS